MTDADYFERIVNEVMRRLREINATDGSGEAGNKDVKKSIEIGERVVTLASVQGRLDGVDHVVVRRNAVVTPSVRDELRDRDIAIVRDGSQS